MGKKKPSAAPRAPFQDSHPHLSEFLEFLPEFNRESDRGMALIATSFIDELLKRVLLSFLMTGRTSSSLLEGFNAPLGNFSTRIAAAAALARISEAEQKEADQLRKVRNRFAHDVHVSFSDQSVAALCGTLQLAAKSYGDVVVDARGQFATSATALILNLTIRPHYVSQHRRKAVQWTY